MSLFSSRFAGFVLSAVALLACPTAASAHHSVKVSAPSTPATQITATSARLKAIIASDRESTFHVEVGRTHAYGFRTAERSNALRVPVEVWATVYGMAPSTKYHFRVVATTQGQTTTGPDRSFTTHASAGPPSAESLTEVPPAPEPDPVPIDPFAAPDLEPPLLAAGDATSSGSPRDSQSGSAPALLPVQSETVVAELFSGSVLVRAPGSASFTSLSASGRVPVGSVVDARHGVMQLSADTGSSVDTGRFWGAVFRVDQRASGAAELSLMGGRPARCARQGSAPGATAAKSPVRGLWGKDDKGRFRTRGRNSVATVRGTVWYVAERCAGTLTRVLEGAVSVRDTRSGRTVLVKAGGHLMVRDRARAAARHR